MSNTKLRKNKEIRARQVRVIYNEINFGVIDLHVALQKANDLNLDLVEISPNTNPPVCKIVDWGKFLYETSKKNKKAPVIKNHEVKFGVNIDDHDLATKLNLVKGFIDKGDRVTITISFKGRQNAHPEIGFELSKKIINAFPNVKNTEPKLVGKSIKFLVHI